MLTPFGLANFQDFRVQPLDPTHPTEVVAPTAMNRALRAHLSRAVEELEMPPVRCPSSSSRNRNRGWILHCIALYCIIYNMFIYSIYHIYIYYSFIYLFKIVIYSFICLCICMCVYIYNYMLNTPIDGYFGENWPTPVRSPWRWRGECSVYCWLIPTLFTPW